MFNVLLILAIPSTATLAAETNKLLYWNELVPAYEPIENPFEEFTYQQIDALRELSKLEAMLSQIDSAQEHLVLEQIQTIKKNLAADGLDAGLLLELRKQIIAQNTKIARSANLHVVGKKQRIPGFVTPIEMEGTLVTEFFLVPTPGACIHTPPPAPNQIIHVVYPEGFQLDNIREPMVIEGKLITEKNVKDVSYSDGAANVNSIYSMSAISVTNYDDEK
ncbi:hypothetical protein RJ45_11580 [Photobacterium gaetbulicola]|uniref:DUF3299 domain-containing protein n=1 Tax=Photobacterium gaetbulicola TaxID=1295392 RepID=A0A0B9GFH6_9GAMM|nr:hypothetical protein RJ45_11580 [Photobacterium gaetbulicola]